MKKIYVILAVAALLCVAACGNKKKAECKECEKCEKCEACDKEEAVKEAAEAAAEEIAPAAEPVNE